MATVVSVPRRTNLTTKHATKHGSLGFNTCLNAYHGHIICKNRQYDIHITAQIYFLHISSQQKANIYFLCRMQIIVLGTCHPGFNKKWRLESDTLHITLIYCKHFAIRCINYIYWHILFCYDICFECVRITYVRIIY